MSGSVLVIDDEPHVLAVMRTFLERAGFAVWTAANGEDGWRLVQQHQPDALITDFEMPLLNGRELIDRVIAAAQAQPSLMFLVTSRTDIELRDWVERDERINFLEKPASPRRLVKALREKLDPRALDAIS